MSFSAGVGQISARLVSSARKFVHVQIVAAYSARLAVAVIAVLGAPARIAVTRSHFEK